MKLSNGHSLPSSFLVFVKALSFLPTPFVLPLFFTFAANVLGSPGPSHLIWRLPEPNAYILSCFFHCDLILLLRCSLFLHLISRLHFGLMPPPHIFILVQILCWLLICVLFSCLLSLTALRRVTALAFLAVQEGSSMSTGRICFFCFALFFNCFVFVLFLFIVVSFRDYFFGPNLGKFIEEP